jgi:hypothetical protein
MVVLKRRSRLVTFRVSADEYDELSRSCLISGSRSIAEFARAAVLQNARALGHPVGSLSGDLASVSKALSELDLSLNDVRRRIRGVLGHVHSEDEDASSCG